MTQKRVLVTGGSSHPPAPPARLFRAWSEKAWSSKNSAFYSKVQKCWGTENEWLFK